MSDNQQDNRSPGPFSDGNHHTPSFIVGIGASAGGLDAIERFFDNMPNNTGLAFVIVQHLSPDYKSLMDELLARHTSMQIHSIEDGIEVQANQIYLLPPRNNIEIVSRRLNLIEQNPKRGVNLPIDLFFESLAKDIGNRAIGVILSGTGSDGSRGVPYIHQNGGLVVSQDLDSSSFDGMPRSAIATGHIDIVCPPERMPNLICQYAEDPENFERGQLNFGQPRADRTDRQQLFHLFRRKYGVDFSLYKPTTIDRRLQRRIDLAQCANLEQYLELLNSDTNEFDALYHDLLVEVTEFFRDAKAFEYLQQQVVKTLIEESNRNEEIRIWVPGCATGEEAYSIAMVFRDCAEKLDRNPRIKIFASDVHQTSLDFASTGIYANEDLASLPSDYDRYFTEYDKDHSLVVQEIRQMVVFAGHDVTRDPPFTRIDLVSCRNLLIYLEPDVQKRVLALFHFSLKKGGTLFLGPSETVGDLAKEFDVLDHHWRFFRKLREVRLPEMAEIPMSSPVLNVVSRKLPINDREDDGWLRQVAYEDLLSKYVPASLLVNEFDEVVHSFGDARKLLVQPEGRPTLNVVKMLEGDLRSALAAALHRAKRENKAVIFTDIHHGDQLYRLKVEPWSRGTRSLLMVTFEELEAKPQTITVPADEMTSFQSGEGVSQRLTEMERELDYTRQSLQATVEELETSNEELQSTNEELIASNEELQSTNEELHSVNEELYTVNVEHQRKIGELTQANNDLNNLMTSSNIGTIFLDRELRIRRFTPAISTAFHVLEQDIGRPIDHIAYNLESPDLMDSIHTVLECNNSIEHEVRNREGETYLQRIQPYRSGTGEVQGVVITFDDITTVRSTANQLKQAEEELSLTQRELQDFAYAVSHDLGTPLRHISSHCRIIQEEHNEHLSDQTEKSIVIVRDGAKRLREMIDGLLTYSRIYTQGKPPTDVNLDLLIGEVLSQLQQTIEESGATVNHAPLPELQGDASQLKRLFEILLENAIDYASDEPPNIFIEARREGKFWKISVHDNGIGIKKQHFDRIFIIFQRLKFKEEVDGLGLGLAIAKRIIERHKGWIWVESIESKGSTFIFKLPAN